MTDQSLVIQKFCAKPKNFAWFLGAGSSRSSGLPTANDIIWDLKKRHYCREEGQEILRQDLQNQAVKDKIQSFMNSTGFPEIWSDEEYSTYFEKIFGDDKELQRRYLNGILAEEKSSLSMGNRVLGALMSEGLTEIAFTTNFDSIVEKAVAEISGNTLSAYHLEGSHSANNALNNAEFPFYCKLHGDFRYDSLKNLSVDLDQQNADLSKSFLNAGNRCGFIVAGYSGRDESVMELFREVLNGQNPFPNGLYWTGIRKTEIHPAVEELINLAKSKDIDADFVEIKTYDAFMSRLWSNVESKSEPIDRKVRKMEMTSVTIPMPPNGQAKPIVRLNALPITGYPKKCLSLAFSQPKDWSDLRSAISETEGQLILSKSDKIWCWGNESTIRDAFSDDLPEISETDLPVDLQSSDNLIIKRFFADAIAKSFTKERPLLSRTRGLATYLIVDRHDEDVGVTDPIYDVVGKPTGQIHGLFTPPIEGDERPQAVSWAEALRISIDQRNGQLWLLVDPEIWIWPPRARSNAREFLDKRRADRLNEKYAKLLDAWVKVLSQTDERNIEIDLSPFDNGTDIENPKFKIGNRTAFTKRVVK